MKNVTIKDVAKAAGVSYSTVQAAPRSAKKPEAGSCSLAKI